MKIRTLIVEEEPPARNRIAQFLEEEPEFTITGLCANGPEAVETIRASRPDLVILDMQMGDVDGFKMLRSLEPEQIPLVIFITTYDPFTLQALEAYTLDYLLKPFAEERLRQTLRRVQGCLRGPQANALKLRLLDFLDRRGVWPQRLSRLAVKSAGRVLFVSVDEIDWIQAADNHLNLHVGERCHLVRGRLRELKKQLAPEQFLQIHRSTIVNLDHLQEIRTFGNGRTAIMADGTHLDVGGNYFQRLRELWKPTF